MRTTTMSEATTTSQSYVTSRDGTRIGYLQQGHGPGLVLVQGAGGTAANYADLARALSPHFTVYRPDRRGRGMSPKPYEPGHDIARDVDDIDAILKRTSARLVFGLSSGAVITLEAARVLPRITRAAVYEPPFYPDGISHAGVTRLNVEIERGDLPAALVSSLQVAATAPAPLSLLPAPAARLLARVVLRIDDRRPGPGARLRELLPSIRYDFNVVAGMDGQMHTFAELDKPMLLLSGTRSAAYLRHSIRQLAQTLPDSRHVELTGLGHSGSWNTRRGNGPQLVATALQQFFS